MPDQPGDPTPDVDRLFALPAGQAQKHAIRPKERTVHAYGVYRRGHRNVLSPLTAATRRGQIIRTERKNARGDTVFASELTSETPQPGQG